MICRRPFSLTNPHNINTSVYVKELFILLIYLNKLNTHSLKKNNFNQNNIVLGITFQIGYTKRKKALSSYSPCLIDVQQKHIRKGTRWCSLTYNKLQIQKLNSDNDTGRRVRHNDARSREITLPS